MRFLTIAIFIGLALGGFYYYDGGNRRPQGEAVLKEYEQAKLQQFEAEKQKTNFAVVEPRVIPDGFYFNGFESQGSVIEDKEAIIFRYYKNEGKRYLVVYQRPVRIGETLIAPDAVDWDIVEEVRLKNGSPARYMKKTKVEGGSVKAPFGDQKIGIEFATHTTEFHLTVGDVFVRLISSSGDVSLGGAKAEERVLSKTDLLNIANSFPGL